MAYTSTIAFTASTGVLSGTLALAPPPGVSSTLADLVITGYADGAQANGSAYFGQARTDGAGNWSLSTNNLPAGQHALVVTVDYGAVVASTTVTTTGGSVIGDGSGSRRDLRTNQAPRS